MPACRRSMRSSAFGIAADGVDAVRKAARHNLRDGSDFLKLHASGGVASPTDPIEATQHTPEELRAAVTAAEHRGTYVAAHASTPAAIQQSVNDGIHTIEHGNLLDETTARLMIDAGAVLVPTPVTYHAKKERGSEFGLPKVNRTRTPRSSMPVSRRWRSPTGSA